MKYVDCRYAGDAPVEFIKASECIGRVLRECHNCGADIQPGEWRKAITGKYRDEIGTRYYCAKCEERTSTGEPACLPNPKAGPAAVVGGSASSALLGADHQPEKQA